ncbi:hypothetical protein BV20DRAFT_1053195 [Pilatotrama ljubarskyi]|nr:hypothetical protein BV20DRAFT_1053195 [Pilatotrama ljubarskyi]
MPAFEELPPSRRIMEGVLLPALEELTPPGDVPLPDKPISISGFRCIGSYTWLKDRNPTIVVPGYAREWGDRLLPIQVPYDNTIRTIDENRYHMGRIGSGSSLVPLFRAVDGMANKRVGLAAPGASEEDGTANVVDVDWADVDFVTERNSLRKLIRWIRESCSSPRSPPVTVDSDVTVAKDDAAEQDDATDGSAKDDETATTTAIEAEWDPRKDFRIDLHLCGEKTVLMERWAAFDRERVVPPKGGCRDNFIREATANNQECENGAGHYRIVHYDLDGLKMIVRWEVDASIPLSTSPLSASASSASEYSLPDPPQSVPVPLPVDIEQLARWEDSDSGGAEAWGVSIHVATTEIAGADAAVSAPITVEEAQPETKTALKTDSTLANWGNSKAEQAAAWDAPSSDAKPACPTEQTPSVGTINLEAAIAVWDTPTDDPVAAAAAWGDPDPRRASQQNRSTDNGDTAALWGVTSNDDAAAWGVGPVESAGGADTFVPATDLTVVRGGTLLAQSSVIELATRSAQYVDLTKIEDTFFQLFLTQTPANLLAIHTRGLFDRVERQELDSPEFVRVQEDPLVQRSLKQLVTFLRAIQDMLKKQGNVAKLSLVCEKGKLRVYNRVGDEDHLLAAEFSRFGI